MERPQDYVLHQVQERGVTLVRLWFTDVVGQLKSFAISPVDLEQAFESGMVFDGSSIEGFSRHAEEDMLARPDPTTFELTRWMGHESTSARMFCDIHNADGTPFDGDPRGVLRRVLTRAAADGFACHAAPELEYFVFDAHRTPGSPPTPLDGGSYFDLTATDLASEIRQRTLSALEAMSIPVEYAFHEDSPSQHEIDLRPDDALTMADSIMTFRLIVREVALERGAHATFMPKPLAGVQGSGMHTHLSLYRDDVSVLDDAHAPHGLSAVGRAFIGGLLAHAPEITAVTNQWVNSYKRLADGYEAPKDVSWASHDRAALVRVPTAHRGADDGLRIEYRAPDAACNPYLAFAVMLAAGLAGIAGDYPLEAGGRLPSTLAEALDEMEAGSLVRETLGEHLFRWLVRNKRQEWQRHQQQVSEFELEQYYTRL